MGQGDWALEALFDMAGIGEAGGGYWYKIEVRRVAPTRERPHGIDYSLTVHAPSGERLFGIDNAHPVTEGSGPGRRRPAEWDHEHRGGGVRVYDYATAADLLADFFAGMDRVLDERKVRR